MDNAWKELQPKNIYQGRKSHPLKEDGRSALLYLYQPLIGGEALSLYLTLLSEISAENGQSPEGLHADLLSSLSCGLPQFYEARKRLEGIGLLDVFYKEDASLGACFIYELLEPMDAFAFFKDSVLSFLLLEKVGERRYEQLVQLFQPKTFSSQSYQKITKKFLDVYRFSEAAYAANQDKIENVQAGFQQEKPGSLVSDSDQPKLDWAFLTEWLTKKHIPVLEDPLKEQIEMYHQLYGVDELTIGEWIVLAYDFSEQKVSTKELQRIVLTSQAQKTKKSDPTSPETGIEETVTADSSLPNAIVELIKEAQSIPPMKYLEALKQEKGGFVSKQETWLMQDLVSRSGLSSSVINILVNYVLVIRNQASLNASFVNTIANEWAQNKITTPEEAIEHIRTISNQAKQTKKKTTQSYASTRRNVRREKLPDWVNKPKEEQKISSEKKAEIERRFKEYFAKKEGDS